jgi:hypothetical protein
MRDSWLVYVALASIVVLACGALVASWTRRRLGIAAAVVFAVAVGIWALDLLAISSGYRDADGFADCLDACTGVHFSAAVGFLVPPLLIALAALAGLVALVQRLRAHRAP